MKEITLIFPGLGIRDVNQADVFVYDSNNKLIAKGRTCNGKICFCLENKCFYKIAVKSRYENIKRFIYINQDTFYLALSNSLVNQNDNNIITFYLTDYNYPKLPIMKGTIILG